MISSMLSEKSAIVLTNAAFGTRYKVNTYKELLEKLAFEDGANFPFDPDCIVLVEDKLPVIKDLFHGTVRKCELLDVLSENIGAEGCIIADTSLTGKDSLFICSLISDINEYRNSLKGTNRVKSIISKIGKEYVTATALTSYAL